MSVSNEVQDLEVSSSSAESIKRSSLEAADDQLREIKKLRREEPRSFKRKSNEIKYKFNLKEARKGFLLQQWL